jgi:murein DD-endopeptidase
MKTIRDHNRLILLTVAVITPLFFSACSGSPAKSRSNDYAYSIYGERAAAYAQKMIGTRYHYGGNHPSQGFDCSGLVQYSYSLAGVQVPRNTKYQFRSTRYIPSNKLKRGDLLFFNQQGKRYSHVGIYIGNSKFVHAPSTGKRVRISSLKNRYWRRSLSSTRRFQSF